MKERVPLCSTRVGDEGRSRAGGGWRESLGGREGGGERR